MNQFFKRLPLRSKLFIIAIVPLACLLYFATQTLYRQTQEIAVIDRLLKQVDRSVSILRLVDELQQERRSAVLFIMHGKDPDGVLLQQSKTDAFIAGLQQNYGSSLGRFESYTMLNTLSQRRAAIRKRELSQNEVINYYTNVISRLQSLSVTDVPELAPLEDIRQQLIGQQLLTEMATNLGIVRMDLYYLILKGESWPSEIGGVMNHYELFNALTAEFKEKAAPQDLAEYERRVAGDSVRPILAYIDNVIRQRSIDTTKLSPEVWWRISADAVDNLKVQQRAMVKAVIEKASDVHQRERNTRNRNLVIVVLIIFIVIWIVFYTIRVISDTLGELRSTAEQIADGVTGLPLHITSQDAIGSLGRSLKRIDHANSVLATAAIAIGRGDFSVLVNPRSERDELGTAVMQMKEDLQRLRQQHEQKIWIQTGISRINGTLLEDRELVTLCEDAMRELVDYLHAQTAAFYVTQRKALHLAASYALPASRPAPVMVMEGTTLAGQAMVSRQPLYLEHKTPAHLQVESALLHTTPAYLLVLPLVYAGTVEGVIEIAALQPFPAAMMEYATEAGENIAVAIRSAKSRDRQQELLEETQSQAEELQAQHTEMENLNAELEAQTQKLQASEEELRVQQEELMQSNHELEERSGLLEEKNQLIIERNLEIQQKAEELALSTKYKSEFLANMSHELRTPLNSILLLSRLLSENHEQNLSKDQIEYSQVIQSSGKGLLTLIDEILDLSKIESGKMELEYGNLYLAELLQDLRQLFLPVAVDKGLELILQVDERLPAYIETDRVRLEQVLKNLLSNALKFTSAGQVSLHILPNARQGDIVDFVVRDSGIGIPEEKQQVIFEAFQQADGSTRRKYGGTGLGLSISRELTRLLGGTIMLESASGTGSTFTISIPVSKLAANHPAPAAAWELPPDMLMPEVPAADRNVPSTFVTSFIPEAVADDREHIVPGERVILIIEDDRAFAKALLDFTREKGYKGIVSVRGDEGLELARQYKPAGILLDILLPVKDGWQVMDELKSDWQTRAIPVHMMSSLEMKKESISKGAIDFITKPIDQEQMQHLFGKLEHVLNRTSRKVLIVEDNPQHAKALAYFLGTFNVSAEISSNLQQGVSALHSDEVDCVILDMGIPDMNAYKTLEAVKANEGLENLPVIIFTGKSLSKPEEQRIRQYADSIVIKTAHSYQRMLDEVSLFLHLVEENDGASQLAARFSKLAGMGEVLHDKKVLIADDDVRNIFSLSKALEKHKMEILSAVDGREALQQMNDHPDIDIVLMDMMMPEMDGYEAIAHIRKDPRFRQLPIIAVTAKAMMGDREKCIQAGASDYISKPVDVDQLLSLLRVWLYDRMARKS